MDKISQKIIIIIIIMERMNIAKTIKTKYAITKIWWWNFKIKFKTILEWENLSGKKIFEWKKMGKFFKITWNSEQKIVLYTLVQLVNLSCIVSVIPLYNNHVCIDLVLKKKKNCCIILFYNHHKWGYLFKWPCTS